MIYSSWGFEQISISALVYKNQKYLQVIFERQNTDLLKIT